MTTNAICTYDFTTSRGVITKVDFIKKLNKFAKKWCFQLEKGLKTGYEHWQGRLSLKVKSRLTDLVARWDMKTHFSITSKCNQRNNFYVMKEETRLEGPWLSEDNEDSYIPRQIREITKLYPWQESVIEKSKVWDTRHIDVIVDKEGNIGKSILVGWMRAYKLGKVLPYCNNFKDIMRMVCNMPTATTYVIDMPRAIDKEKLHSMYSGIESVKNGYAYDDRYHFTEKNFDCPNIWVFTNTVPDMSLVSMDRWRIWMVRDKKLEPYHEECNLEGEL